jgi:hypothetical protein
MRSATEMLTFGHVCAHAGLGSRATSIARHAPTAHAQLPSREAVSRPELERGAGTQRSSNRRRAHLRNDPGHPHVHHEQYCGDLWAPDVESGDRWAEWLLPLP